MAEQMNQRSGRITRVDPNKPMEPIIRSGDHLSAEQVELVKRKGKAIDALMKKQKRRNRDVER
jgi:hypothetical protein